MKATVNAPALLFDVADTGIEPGCVRTGQRYRSDIRHSSFAEARQ
ncbi:MAG: hypothetical protein ACLS6O_01525 [Bifidobacterium sp.]